MPEIKKILVIRFSSLGDIILTFPLLKKIRKKHATAEIHFLTKNVYEEALKLSPQINKILLYENSLRGIREKIKQENYDVIIDLHKNFKSIFVSIFNSRKLYRYKKENFKKFLLVKFKINLFKEIIPVYKKYILSAKDILNANDFEYEFDQLKFTRDSIVDGKYTVIAPSTRHFTKTYPAEKFIDYINRSPGRKFLLVGDKSENDISVCSLIESKCKNVLNMCGKLNMIALTNIIHNSEEVICNDSAILHLSEAAGKKVIAVFGSTVKEFGFFPQLKNSVVLENTAMKCRPCTHIGRESCPEIHFRCMDIQIPFKN
ncbi:MAG TPA: glycosyltransferase family 9 protein [Ignavibacteria bacterium]|mgnify:CR=1 FL=1|nr:glycosyltransferase family 9 protein [Ignavibacteria bacterium]